MGNLESPSPLASRGSIGFTSRILPANTPSFDKIARNTLDLPCIFVDMAVDIGPKMSFRCDLVTLRCAIFMDYWIQARLLSMLSFCSSAISATLPSLLGWRSYFFPQRYVSFNDMSVSDFIVC